MCEIRLQRLTNMVIEKETDTGVVLISQTSTLHLRPSPGPASTKGFLAALTHSSKTGNTRRGSHGADPTEPGIPLGSQAQPAALLSSLCTLQTAFPNQRCSGWGRRGGTGAAGRAALPRVTAVGRLPRESCPRRVASNWLLVARSRQP